MDAAAARKLVGDLVEAQQLEVRRAEIVARDLAKHLAKLASPPTARELGDWLSAHPQIEEVYAGEAELAELIARYLAPPPAEAAPAVPEQLPEIVRELADDPAPYLVYSDWLQERGDPVGELIVLGVAATASSETAAIAAFEKYVKQHENVLFGGIPRVRECVQLTWHNGLIRAINDMGAVPLDPPTWQALLRLRVCEIVRTLSLSHFNDSCTQAMDVAIAAAAPPAFTELSWAGSWPLAMLRRGLHTLMLRGTSVPLGGDLELPEFELLQLYLSAFERHDTGAIRMPVRALDAKWCTPAMLITLAPAQFPRLERLAISLQGCSIDHVRAFVGQCELPMLRHVAFSGGRLDAKAFVEFARLPALAQLTTLELVGLELDDAALATMLPALRAWNLTTLDLSANELSERALATIPNASRGQQAAGTARDLRFLRWAGSRLDAAEEIVDDPAWQALAGDGEVHRAIYTGETAYELYVGVDDLARYNCTCPSRYQPCKHVVALALRARA
jgi:uncharacterized protein (TIGR02996 family)